MLLRPVHTGDYSRTIGRLLPKPATVGDDRYRPIANLLPSVPVKDFSSNRLKLVKLPI